MNDVIQAAIAAGQVEPVPSTTFKIFTGILKAQRAADGGMKLLGTASSTVRDHHGDNMLRTALEDMLHAANNNMTIFLNHSYNVPEDVAGSSKQAQLIQRSYAPDEIWDLDLDVDINTANPRAVEAFNAIEGGTKLGLSIGALIPDGGAVRDKQTGAYTIAHVELLETSIVGIPANPRSWVQSAVKALKSADALDNTITATNTMNLIVRPTLDEVKAAPVAEEGICGERNEDESIACTADPGHLGEHSWSAAGEIADVQVTTDTVDGSDAVTDGSQGASDSEPEPEPASEDVTLSAEPDDDLGPIATSLTAALGMLESTAAELVATRLSLSEAEIARDTALRERDEVLGLANSVIAETSQIIEKLADIPVGRRSVLRQVKSEFDGLERIYSPAILKLMRGSDVSND